MKLLLDTLNLKPRFVLQHEDLVLDSSEFWLTKDSLHAALAEAFCRLEATPMDLQWLAWNRGPGSFTGIKVGSVVARTMAMVSGLSLYGYTSFDWMCYLDDSDVESVYCLNAYQGEWFQAMMLNGHWEMRLGSEPLFANRRYVYCGPSRFQPNFAMSLEDGTEAELRRFLASHSFGIEHSPLYLKKSNAERKLGKTS